MKRLFGAFVVTVLVAALSLSLPAKGGAAAVSHKSIADGSTNMAVDLYRQLGLSKGNVFFSPFSIASALAMTYAGARDETANQMKEVLHFQLEQSGVNSAFRSLNLKLAQAARQSDQELSIANALVLTGGKVNNAYEKTLRTYYGAEVFGGDLATINKWVKRKTEGKIETILDKLSANSVCVILNAVYFKGTWNAQFDKNSTRDAPFHTDAAGEVKTALMHRKDNYKLLDENDVQVLSLPYKGKTLSMVIILPRDVEGLDGFEKKLNAKGIKDMLAKLDKQPDRKVSVYLPRFRMETGYDLVQPFQEMGMKDAFSPQADFSGTGWRKGYLWIGQIKHKAFVEVNEEGTEAAAATAVEMVTKAVPARELEFRADHPFFFMIRDNETGTILFMGRMVDPRT